MISIISIADLLSFDLLRGILGWRILPPLIALETGVLLVSLKIIWMIHRNMKITHFQFWILHSIDTRLNEILELQRKTMKQQGGLPHNEKITHNTP